MQQFTNVQIVLVVLCSTSTTYRLHSPFLHPFILLRTLKHWHKPTTTNESQLRGIDFCGRYTAVTKTGARILKRGISRICGGIVAGGVDGEGVLTVGSGK